MPATNNHTPAAQRAAATTKRWATAVAAAAYAVWVARLALGVYEAEAAARLRAVRPGMTVWHGAARRRDARAHTTDAQASPVFMMEACALGCAPPPGWQGSKPSQGRAEAASSSRCCEPRAVTAPKRRAHSAAYGGVRHSTAPTTAPAVPVVVWYDDDADDEAAAAAARQGRTGWPWRACAVRALAVRAYARPRLLRRAIAFGDAPGRTQ